MGVWITPRTLQLSSEDDFWRQKGKFQVLNCKLDWPTMMTIQWPWSDHLDRRMGVWVTSSGGRGGRQQLSGGPSLLTSTPVSCRWGQRGRKIKEKVFFTVRHILFQMKHLEFVFCAKFSFQVQSAILKLKEFPFMTLMMITPECFWKHLAIKCHLDFAPLSECCVEKDGDSCGAAFSQRTIREMARNLCCHTNLPHSVPYH